MALANVTLGITTHIARDKQIINRELLGQTDRKIRRMHPRIS